MTVQLAGIDREAAERARLKAARAATASYAGTDLQREVRAALRKRTQGFTLAGRLSESEADALAQAIALAALERPSAFTLKRDERSGALILRDRAERIARFQSAAAGLARDSRSWIDSADGWKPRPVAERTESLGRKSSRPTVGLALSVAEQAERFRLAEREQAARVSLTSTDALAAAHAVDREDGSSGTDWLAAAAHRESEQSAGEPIPAAALAPDSRLLARATARRIAALSGAAEQDLRLALYAAAGDSLAALCRSERVAIATAKRRSARGFRALRKLGSAAVREARREAVEALKLGPESRPERPAVSELERVALAAVSGAQREARRIAAAHGAGSRGDSRSRLAPGQAWNGPRTYWLGRGSAGEALRYGQRLEAALAREPYRSAPGLVPAERPALCWDQKPSESDQRATLATGSGSVGRPFRLSAARAQRTKLAAERRADREREAALIRAAAAQREGDTGR